MEFKLPSTNIITTRSEKGELLVFFNFKIRKLILLLILLPIPFLSINMEQRPLSNNWLAQPFYFLARGSQDFVYGFTDGIRSATKFYLDLLDIKKENKKLSQLQAELQSRLQRYGELETENNRLRQLLGFTQLSKMTVIPAQIIGRDLIPDHHTLTINKGLRDGLKSGQAVVSTEGAIGYVFKPGPSVSSIMLITDRYAVVDGIIQRTRAHGILEGKSPTECSLKYVERSEDVKVGDLVVTGGLDNIFPKGFPIAVVQNVERKTFSVSLKIDLKPVVNPYKVEEVMVIADAANADLSEHFYPSSTNGAETGSLPMEPNKLPNNGNQNTITQ